MKLKYLLILFISLIALSFTGCEEDDVDPKGIKTKDDTNEKTDTATNFTIPSYDDDYSDIASWSDRDKWNLANVHDPSVAYYDGYYYMYATDASYLSLIHI